MDMLLDKMLITLQKQIQKNLPSDGMKRSAQEKHAAGLMRVNHAGEVAAQALYRGQALTAKTPETRAHLLEAAAEEQAHLAWCAERVESLGEKTSVLEPVWFAGAYALGAATGLLGDRWSLGFVAETEKQVVEHLEKHLQELPQNDQTSRKIIQKMQSDEAKHGAEAKQAGGQDLPLPVRGLMRLSAKIMTNIAYKI